MLMCIFATPVLRQGVAYVVRILRRWQPVSCRRLVLEAYTDQRPVASAFGLKVVDISRRGQYNIDL